MSARNWVDKLRGLLQREDDPASAPLQTEETPAPDAAVPAPAVAAPTEAPAAPQVQKFTPPPPLKARREPKLQRVMPGTPKEQVDWSLRQIATVGDQILSHLKQHEPALPANLERDMTLLKLGYSVVTLALRTKQTQPSIETLRSLRTALKGALLSALRKDYHKHASESAHLGASMVERVDGELTTVDNEVQSAMSQMQSGSTASSRALAKQLQPLLPSDKNAEESYGAEVERLFVQVNEALPVQDLLL